MTISFTTKQNQRLPGQEVTITGEMATVSLVAPYIIKLIEVPLQSSPSTVSIPGYLETTSSNPAPGRYFVNYFTGFITFNGSAAGAAVSVNYKGTGSIVDALDIDTVQSILASFANEVITARGTQPSLNARLSVSLAPDGSLVVSNVSVDPLTPAVGQIWYNTVMGQFIGQSASGPVILG